MILHYAHPMQRQTSWEEESQLHLVILSGAKNLAATDLLGIVRAPRVHARDEILRFAQNDKVERVRQHKPTLLFYSSVYCEL
jgi:hypothetical protein